MGGLCFYRGAGLERLQKTDRSSACSNIQHVLPHSQCAFNSPHTHTHTFITAFTNGKLIITPPNAHTHICALFIIDIPGVLIKATGGLCLMQPQTNCINQPKEKLMIVTRAVYDPQINGPLRVSPPCPPTALRSPFGAFWCS